MGARCEKAIDAETDHKVKLSSALPYLSAEDPDTAASEGRGERESYVSHRART